MEHFKRSTSRDFRINVATLDVALHELSEEEEEDEDDPKQVQFLYFLLFLPSKKPGDSRSWESPEEADIV